MNIKSIGLLLLIITPIAVLYSCHKNNDSTLPPGTDTTSTGASYKWRYVQKDINVVNSYSPAHLHFYNDREAVITGSRLFEISPDSGKSWGGATLTNLLGYGFSVYDNNITWSEANFSDIFYLDYNNQYNNHYASLDTITSIPYLKNKIISGLYNSGPNSGYMLTQEGSIFKISGGFNPSNIKLEYQTSYFKDLGSNNTNGVYFRYIEALDSQNMMVMGNPQGTTVQQPVIIHKKNGTYKEYNFSTEIPNEFFDQIQYVDSNTAYFHTTGNVLYRFSNSQTLTKLSGTSKGIGAFKFIDSKTGYAGSALTLNAAEEYIYKTTDGGKTWTTDFVMDPDHIITAFFARGNEIWAVGNCICTIKKRFLVKYGR